MELFVPSAFDLAGWAGALFAALAFIGLGRLVARGPGRARGGARRRLGRGLVRADAVGRGDIRIDAPARGWSRGDRHRGAAAAALQAHAPRVARARAHRSRRPAVLRRHRQRAAERARHVPQHPAERGLSLRSRLLSRRRPPARCLVSAGRALQSAARRICRGPCHAGLSGERAHRLQFRARAGARSLSRAARRRRARSAMPRRHGAPRRSGSCSRRRSIPASCRAIDIAGYGELPEAAALGFAAFFAARAACGRRRAVSWRCSQRARRAGRGEAGRRGAGRGRARQRRRARAFARERTRGAASGAWRSRRCRRRSWSRRGAGTSRRTCRRASWSFARPAFGSPARCRRCSAAWFTPRSRNSRSTASSSSRSRRRPCARGAAAGISRRAWARSRAASSCSTPRRSSWPISASCRPRWRSMRIPISATRRISRSCSWRRWCCWRGSDGPRCGRERRAVAAGLVVLVVVAPLAFAALPALRSRAAGLRVWELAQNAAPLLGDGERVALVLPGDNGSVAAMLAVALARYRRAAARSRSSRHERCRARQRSRALPPTAMAPPSSPARRRAALRCSGTTRRAGARKRIWLYAPVRRGRWSHVLAYGPLCLG